MEVIFKIHGKHTIPLLKRIHSRRKEFAPKRKNNSFLLEKNRFHKEVKDTFDRIACPESIYSPYTIEKKKKKKNV